jgi:hypothetical protein
VGALKNLGCLAAAIDLTDRSDRTNRTDSASGGRRPQWRRRRERLIFERNEPAAAPGASAESRSADRYARRSPDLLPMFVDGFDQAGHHAFENVIRQTIESRALTWSDGDARQRFE